MGFLVWCSSGTQLRLAPPQDILRGEQMLLHHPWRAAAQEQVCSPQQGGRQAEGCGGLGKWKRTHLSRGAPARKERTGEGGHM